MLLLVMMTIIIGLGECSNESPLTSWCVSKNFFYNIDHIAIHYPTHYRYCTTKAATCRKFIEIDIPKTNDYSYNHTAFFRFCRFVNRRNRRIRSRNQPKSNQPKPLQITANVVIDSTVVDFLFYVFGLRYKSLIDVYINDIFRTASDILSVGMTDRNVTIRPISISHIALIKFDRGLSSQKVYNEWCDHTHRMLGDQEVNKAHIHIIMSKIFSKLTDHVGYTLKDGMCSGKWSCTIIQDDGPQLTPIVLAHEIAHLLGIPHIEEIDDCYERDRYLIMSEQLQANSHRFRWSTCVKNRLRNIDKEFSCLALQQKSSFQSSLTYSNGNSQKKTAVTTCNYSPDEQCKMMFNDVDSQFCASKKRQQMICNKLYCSMGQNGYNDVIGRYDPTQSNNRRSNRSPHICQSRSVGALEGTSCGNDRICRDGRCVQMPIA